jgi:hypothetical protein
MKRKTLFLLISALLCPLAARAQSTTPPPSAQQPAKPSLDDDPQFKRLSPEQQKLVRQAMESLDKAVADQKNVPLNPDELKPRQPIPPAPAPAGCIASPVKKPKFHIPKSVQDAINKQAKQLGGKTGVDLDPNAPAQTVNDAQKNIGNPCPPAPAAAPRPANK